MAVRPMILHSTSLDRRRFALLGLSAAFAPGAALAASRESLPDYRPAPDVSGVIRVCGARAMKPMLEDWQAAFRALHPKVWFENDLKGTASAQFGLHMNVADIALSGRQIFPYEYYGIYRRSQLLTVEVPIATGSVDARGKSTALAIFVHKDNPLAQMTLEQLDRVFGAQRTGGWQRMEWMTAVARGAETNIRTWGQMGLTGEWADKAIRPYGPPGLYPGGVSFFQTRVMGGADTWNEALMEYDDRDAMLRALEADRYGLAYANLSYARPGVKALALAERAGGPFVPLTRRTVADRSYPLARYAYLYLAPDTAVGDEADPKMSPKISAFVRFILSRQGQRIVEREGDYLPLTAEVVTEQMRVLNLVQASEKSRT